MPGPAPVCCNSSARAPLPGLLCVTLRALPVPAVVTNAAAPELVADVFFAWKAPAIPEPVWVTVATDPLAPAKLSGAVSAPHPTAPVAATDCRKRLVAHVPPTRFWSSGR